MYTIARLVLSEKNVYKDKNNNILKKCIILSSNKPPIFIKCKRKFSPSDIYVKIKYENNELIEMIQLGVVGNENDDFNIFYHLHTIGWMNNSKLDKNFKNYLKYNSHNDNSIEREIYNNPVITVDPDNSTDLDDGFTFSEDDIFYYLDIHIADPVSFFSPNSEFTNIIFDEILKRISTCYIEESCHLFPESFINIVSFLKNNNDAKRSMSFIFKINKLTKIIDTKIKLLSLINIVNLSYEQFQYKCDNNIAYNDSLNKLGILLIDIMKLNYNKEYLNTDFSHKIIEIFMLFTNWTAGNYLSLNAPYFIARTQEEFCSKENLTNIPEYITNFLNFSANYQLINTDNSIQTNHFSLGLDNYAHISSPMRRTVDFINHIIIYSCLNNIDNESQKIISNITDKIDIEYINNTLKRQKKISSSYQILKHIKNVNNIFKACILDYIIINENTTFINIVVYDKENNFKKILNVELPINSGIILHKFNEFNVELFYNSVNYKTFKFPFSIKII
jgi:exoribonuclease R